MEIEIKDEKKKHTHTHTQRRGKLILESRTGPLLILFDKYFYVQVSITKHTLIRNFKSNHKLNKTLRRLTFQHLKI